LPPDPQTIRLVAVAEPSGADTADFTEASAPLLEGEAWVQGGVLALQTTLGFERQDAAFIRTWRAVLAVLRSAPPFPFRIHQGAARGGTFARMGDLLIVRAPASALPQLEAAMKNLPKDPPTHWLSFRRPTRELLRDVALVAERDADGWLRTPGPLGDTRVYTVDRFLTPRDFEPAESGTVELEYGRLWLRVLGAPGADAQRRPLPSRFWAWRGRRLVEIGLCPIVSRPGAFGVFVARDDDHAPEAYWWDEVITPVRIVQAAPPLPQRRQPARKEAAGVASAAEGAVTAELQRELPVVAGGVSAP
jgi:hypothetical protein